MGLARLFNYWFFKRPVSHRLARTTVFDPQGRGLLIGRQKKLLRWGKIQKLIGFCRVFKTGILEAGWYGNYIIVLTNGQEIATRQIPEAWEEKICEKAELKKKRYSYLYGQEIFERE